jgi:hypothetical protein
MLPAEARRYKSRISAQFLPSNVFNNMARFVFRFVFSTTTYFQQLLRFVFRFVPVCFWCPILCYQ